MGFMQDVIFNSTLYQVYWLNCWWYL